MNAGVSVRTYYDRTRHRARRPLYGPKAHPYLVATRELEQALAAAPESEQERRRTAAIQQLVQDRSPGFAAIVDFALRERALARRLNRGKHGTKAAFCHYGHSLAPGSPHLKVERDGSRFCGTCKDARTARRRRVG